MTDVPALLLQLSDPHLFADPSRELYGVNTEATFRTTLTRAIATAPGPLDAIIVTGDIAEDRHPDTYRRFRPVMREIGARMICIPGNHEDPGMMAAMLDEPPMQVCGAGAPAGVAIGARLLALDRPAHSFQELTERTDTGAGQAAEEVQQVELDRRDDSVLQPARTVERRVGSDGVAVVEHQT